VTEAKAENGSGKRGGGVKPYKQSAIAGRRDIIKAVRAEDLRERIQAGNLITSLHKMQAKLLDIHGTELDSVQVARIAKASEISLRLLSKCLPDLKACEITTRRDESVTLSQVPEQQRAAINAAISQALGIVDNGGGSPAEGIHSQNNQTPPPRYQVSGNGFSDDESQRPRHEFSENEVVDGEYQVLPDDSVGYDSSS
jgi:hypothetical protein